ncbi:hypothetical protein Tco_0459081 [Tanacetum coccineum]
MWSVRLPEVKTKNTPWWLETSRSFSREEVDSCGDLNHLIGECLKPLKDKNQRAFVGGSWSDSGEEDDEKAQDETCLVAQASNEGLELNFPINRFRLESRPELFNARCIYSRIDG